MERVRKRASRIGYAVGGDGRGVVYARMGDGHGQVLRAPFRLEQRAVSGREAGFAALCAIVPSLRKHASELDLILDDAELVADLTLHRELPVDLMLPYVRARCALNAFKAVRLRASTAPNDLAARALAEVSMRIAA